MTLAGMLGATQRLMSRLAMPAEVVTLVLCMGIPGVAGAQAPHRHMYGKDFPFAVQDLPASRLRSDLERLPANAKARGLSNLHRFNFPAQDADDLRVDSGGAPYYVDPRQPLPPEDLPADSSQGETPSVMQSVDPSKVFRLHSRPTSTRKVYLNTQGFNVTGTAWNDSAGRTTLYALPFSLDSDSSTFTQDELDAVAELWKRVAEDFAPFDIDVTTERPSSFGPQTAHILVTRETDAYGYYMAGTSPCNCGGIAYIDVWNRSDYTFYQPALVFYNNLASYPHYIAEAASHEFGHNLSLAHDGTSTVSYYGGNGSGYTSWGPIMGVGYYSNVTQWSKGEYFDANNTQDDLALISARLAYLADDRGNSASAASALSVNNLGQVISTSPVTDPDNLNPANKGIINSRTDVDYFYVDATTSGTIDLTVTPVWLDAFVPQSYRGANLDVKATLYNSSGAQIGQSDPTDDTYARVIVNVAPGRYYLAVEGVGVGDPLTVGYTDYASVGQYFINGTIPVAATQTVRLGAASYSVNEGAGSIVIPVTRSSTTGSVTVNYATGSGTATAGSDFGVTIGTLSFAAGVGSLSVTIPILNDTAVESGETFTFALSNPTGAALGSPSSATVTIIDDDANGTPLSNGQSISNLSGAVGSATYFYIDVPSGATSLTVGTSGGSGDADLYVRAGSLPTTSAYDCASLSVTTAETCAIGSPTAGRYYILLYGYSAYSGVTLLANYTTTSQTVQFGAASYSVNEGAGSLVIPVTRSSTAGTVTVNYATSGGTAISGSDFTASSGTLSFAAGVSNVSIVIPIINDTTVESTETFTVTLSSPTGATLGSPSSATVSIVDNESSVTPLGNGEVVSNLSGAGGSSAYFYIDVPPHARNLTVTTSGGSGDVDLYVRAGSLPTTSTFSCASTSGSNGETCSFKRPASGRYYILVYGYNAYSGASLQARVQR